MRSKSDQKNDPIKIKKAIENKRKFEEGWDDMQKGIKKLKRILDGLPEPQFKPQEHMMLYTYPPILLLSIFLWIPLFIREALLFALFWFVFDFDCRVIYNLCTEKPPHDHSSQLYNKYKEEIEQYTGTVRFITLLFFFSIHFKVLFPLCMLVFMCLYICIFSFYLI